MLTITLRQIFDAGPCYDPRDRGLLEKDHPLDAPLNLLDIYTVCGYSDTIWCFAAVANESLRFKFMSVYMPRLIYLLPERIKAPCESIIMTMSDYAKYLIWRDDAFLRFAEYKNLVESIEGAEFGSYRSLQAAHATIEITNLPGSSFRAADAIASDYVEHVVSEGGGRDGVYSIALKKELDWQIEELFKLC